VRPEVDPGGERDRSVWVSERLYRALIRLYPEEVRWRYAEEMARYFGDLCREEWHSRGAEGMVLLWARTLPDLAFSVLKGPTVLEAIVRRGKLTAAGAVLESSLTVEETHRMLQVLVAEGHL
jgi:hypothetical protein